MKTTILKISFICLFMSLMGAGCKKNQEILWEISPDSKTTIIQKEENGIQFKFCLLNEEGEPATTFKKGENFKFHFEITNNSGVELYFIPNFGYNNNDFCRVINSSNQDKGQPFKLLNVTDVGLGAYAFSPNTTILFEVDWADQRQEYWYWEQATYESLHQTILPNGKYYTQFSYHFKFEKAVGSAVDANELRFQINFEIN
jgi:hypothetical protein